MAVGAEEKVATKKCPSVAKVSYKSSDDTIATVAEDGTVKAVKAGKVTITATSDYGKSVSKDVTVKDTFGITDLQATSASTLVATLATPLSETAKVEITKTGITTPVSGEVKADGTTLTFSATANLAAAMEKQLKSE